MKKYVKYKKTYRKTKRFDHFFGRTLNFVIFSAQAEASLAYSVFVNIFQVGKQGY